MATTNSFTDEEELVYRLRTGDESAFSDLIVRYQQRVYALALRVVLLEADAEEVVQDVFVSLYRNIDDFQGRCAFSSWIYRITYNCALMKMRSFKRRLRREQQSIGLGCCNTEDLCPTVEEHFINRESLGLARDIVDSLPESFKAIFWLRDISGLSGAETAEMLGLSPAAVKSRLHRARAMIRKKGVFFF